MEGRTKPKFYKPAEIAAFNKNRIELKPLFDAYRTSSLGTCEEDALLGWIQAELLGSAKRAFQGVFETSISEIEEEYDDQRAWEWVNYQLNYVHGKLKAGDFEDYTGLASLLSLLMAAARPAAVEQLEEAPTELPVDEDGECVYPQKEPPGADCLHWTPELDVALTLVSKRDREFITHMRFCPTRQDAAKLYGINLESLDRRIRNVASRLKLALQTQVLLSAAP